MGTVRPETASQRSPNCVARSFCSVPETRVAPDPTPVLALHRVVQDAAAQRRLRTCGVVLHCAASNSSKSAKLAGPSTKAAIGADFSGFTPGVTSTRTREADEFGCVRRQCDGGEPPEGHPDDADRVGSERRSRWRGPRRCWSRTADPSGAVRRSGRAREDRWRRVADRAPWRPCPTCGRSGPRRGPTRARGPRSPTAGCSACRPGPTSTSTRRTVGGPAREGRTRLRSPEEPELVVGHHSLAQ